MGLFVTRAQQYNSTINHQAVCAHYQEQPSTMHYQALLSTMHYQVGELHYALSRTTKHYALSSKAAALWWNSVQGHLSSADAA